MKEITFYNVLKFSVFSVAILAMTGCATTTGLSKTQCEQLAQNSTDWQKLGEQDGLMGRGADYFNQHLQGCSQKLNISANVMTTPTALQSQNQQLWEQGQQAGLKKYCTPLRAYQLGREGYRFNNALCSPEQTVELLKANDDGLYNYDRQQSVQAGFGWGYAGYDPFWGTRWNGWGGYAVPVIEPVYVPVESRRPIFEHSHRGNGGFFHK